MALAVGAAGEETGGPGQPGEASADGDPFPVAPLPAHALSIGEAANVVGVSRSMLRIWERERLINPRRTAGGHRVYGPEDVARLREIARLRSVERLNAAGIRRELGPLAGSDGSEPADAQPDLGRRLRAIRTTQGWSLAEVAERSGLSISFLSSVERGQSSISVGSLFKLADAYGTTVPGIGGGQAADHRTMVHPSDRPRYVADHGQVVIEDLIASPGALEAQRIVVQPGGGSGEAYVHPGEEFVYVLGGRLTFLLDECEVYLLEEGDSLYFPSDRRHRWWNEGVAAATVLWVNVPVVRAVVDGTERRPRAAGRRASSVVQPDGNGTTGRATSREQTRTQREEGARR